MMREKAINKLWLIVIASSILYGCSSPESDGRRVARLFINYENAVIEYRKNAFAEIIRNFNNYNFTTRLEVREKIQGIYGRAITANERHLRSAEQNHQKLLGRYVTNYNRNSQFQFAFQNYRTLNIPSNEPVDLLLSQLETLILTVIPPIPDIEKIRRDINGVEVREQPQVYFNPNRRWRIKSDDILDINIENIARRGDSYQYNIYLKFLSEGMAFEVSMEIMYVLAHNDDWEIEFLSGQNLRIVRTVLYYDFITTRRTGWPGEFQLELTNSSNVPLLVGGVFLVQFRNEWRHFSILVEGNGRSTVGGLFLGSVLDYNIHFIEGPFIAGTQR